MSSPPERQDGTNLVEEKRTLEEAQMTSGSDRTASSPPSYVDEKAAETGKSKKDKKKGPKQKKTELEMSLEALEAKLSQLPPEEAQVLRSQTEFSVPGANIFTLYKFASRTEICWTLLGVFFAAVHGVALPMFTLVVGELARFMNGFVGDGSLDPDQFQTRVNYNARYFVYIGIAMLGASALESYILVQTGEIQAGRYRKNYLKAIVRQNIAYFDTIGSGQVATRITNDTASVQEAISEKLGNMIQGIATFITAIIIAFTQQWKLSCILLSVVFFNFADMAVGSRVMIKFEMLSESIYTRGSSIAEEALSAIRSTVAFGAQGRLAKRFDNVLQAARKPAEKSAFSLSVMLALIWASLFFTYALAYWEGSRLIASRHTDIGSILCVIISMLIGSFQLGNVAPNVRFIAKGIAASKVLNEAIDRVPVIDSESKDGQTLDDVKGEIVLTNVRFRYPSRPDVLVLPDFSLSIPAGKSCALVGTSGSGKSTIVGILERFYLPLSGSVTLDGVEISDLNVKWLRRQIGYVQQEPTLFADTIFENIAYGLIGTENEFASEEVKRELVVQACKEANAYDFIQKMTDGLDTNVGDRGFLMSGGQKQRIAIARAIVSNPKILLLDEATSALDTKSEGIVQDALDRASNGRTTIVIAHRLSTIKDAHKIVVMNKGQIIEQGNHHELLEKNGTYAQLVDAQKISKLSKGDSDALNSGNGLVIQEDKLKTEEGDTPAKDDVAQLMRPVDELPGIRQPEDSSVFNYIKLLWYLNKSERWMICLGGVSMIFMGYCYSAMGQVTGHIMASIMVDPSEYDEMRHNVNVLSGWFFFIGCMSAIFTIIGMTLITLSSQRLVREVRINLFKSLLNLDIGFFDHSDNSPGALTAILAKEARAIEGLGGATMGQIMQSLTTLIGGVATGIPYSWRVGLVATATVPILLGCGFMRVKVMMSLGERGRRVYEGSGAMAAQFTSAVRTVQSLSREDDVSDKYSAAIVAQIHSSRFAVVRSGILFGLSQGLTPWVIALIFWWGSTCLRKGQVEVLGYYVVFMCITLGAQAAGQIFSYAPDMGKARTAAANVYRIVKAQPDIDSSSPEGIVPNTEDVLGNIEFRDVHFRYPTRPQVPILTGMNLHVHKGQYIALVGASGSGKSTAIGLIERFYDVQKGEVLFDGKNVKDYNLQAMRSHIALVQQEPILYSGTLRENITIGYPGDESEITDEMVYAVARKANIHDFIMSLPDGYNTNSGSRGSLLSGGQKQRVAIARALIRNPKVLLLDEATSALDSDSEKVVQAALDEAARGRTTIAVAHRLSTIQKADIIYVFEGGVVVEQGDHTELLKLNGRYAELVRLQSLEG